MKRTIRKAKAVVEKAAEKVGWKCVGVEMRGNHHVAFLVTDGTVQRRVFTGSTPSDCRALKNLASNVKKVCQRG